ncbi:MAG: tetratricopeptide repeat protein, partial [Candidatus Omnitrophota bacterium]
MAITLPLLLLLTDYFKGRKYDRGMIADKIPFLIFAVCFGILGIYGQGPALRNEQLLGFFDKCLIPSYAVVFYLGKILLPVGLSCVYPYSGIKDISIYLFSLAGCFAITVLMIRSARHTKKVVFSILFFWVTLLPVLQFIPMGSTIVADRYVYMASVGFFYLIAEGIVWAYGKTAEKNRRLGVALIIVLLILITGSLSVLTWNRCAVWKDDVTLWGDVLSKYPNALAYNRRGIYFAERKDYDRALGDFKKVLLYAPYDTDVYIN